MSRGIEEVENYTQGRGIYVIDRGGDRRRLLEPFLDEGLRFIVRSVGERHLIYRGGKISAKDLAQRCPMLYIERIMAHS